MYDEKPTSRVGARRRPYHLRCQACNREFTAKRHDAKYCRAACRVAAQRAREHTAAIELRDRVFGPTKPQK